MSRIIWGLPRPQPGQPPDQPPQATRLIVITDLYMRDNCIVAEVAEIEAVVHQCGQATVMIQGESIT